MLKNIGIKRVANFRFFRLHGTRGRTGLTLWYLSRHVVFRKYILLNVIRRFPFLSQELLGFLKRY